MANIKKQFRLAPQMKTLIETASTRSANAGQRGMREAEIHRAAIDVFVSSPALAAWLINRPDFADRPRQPGHGADTQAYLKPAHVATIQRVCDGRRSKPKDSGNAVFEEMLAVYLASRFDRFGLDKYDVMNSTGYDPGQLIQELRAAATPASGTGQVVPHTDAQGTAPAVAPDIPAWTIRAIEQQPPPTSDSARHGESNAQSSQPE